MKSCNDINEHSNDSPVEDGKSKAKQKPQKHQKKQNESTDYYDVVTNMPETEKENMDQEQEITPSEQTKINKYTDTETNDEIKGIIGSLIEEMKQLCETIHKDITEL